MATNLIVSVEPPMCAMYDDSSMTAFGPTVDGPNCVEIIANFIEFLDEDPRVFTDWQLSLKWFAFIAERGAGGGVPPAPAPDLTPDPTTTPGGGSDTPVESTVPAGDPPSSDAPEPAVPVTAAAQRSIPGEGWASPSAAVTSSTVTTDTVEVRPHDMPIGSRVCWACKGHKETPAGSGTPCWQCDGKGWLP